MPKLRSINGPDAIARLRLHSQRLIGAPFTNPLAAVTWFGAVQAQDYAAAKWSLALRLKTATDASLDNDFNAGRLIRTHVLRPTWHFIPPRDLRWMQSLSAPRVRAAMASSDRKLELTPAVLSRARRVITKALAGTFLARAEITSHLERAGIMASGQRLAHLLQHLELDALICSGPLRGRQFTYALVDERIPSSRKLAPEEALATLAHRYFTSHGPAQLKDFSWWSGLTARQAAEALELAKPHLRSETLGANTYWIGPASAGEPRNPARAHLMALWDEYAIAYTDRSAIANDGVLERLLRMGAAFTAIMVLNGLVVGAWKRRLARSRLNLTFHPLRPLNARQKRLFEHEAQRYARFLGSEVVTAWSRRPPRSSSAAGS